MKNNSTKHQILKAAQKLFVEHGFAGTSMGKIASEAGVNHSLIFYHFKNKEQLWVAVKHSIVEEANQKKNQTLPDVNLPFPEFLKELFIQNGKFYRNHPDIIRMINWQRLEYDTNRHIGLTLNPETQAWIEAFKYYQQRHDIDDHHKPEFIMTLVLSLISSATLDPNVFISDKKNQEAYLDFCVECVLRALQQT